MPHINNRYKLIHNKIEHKLREIASYQILDMNYEIDSKWVDMISDDLYKGSNNSYLLYLGRTRSPYTYATPMTHPSNIYKLLDVREVDLSSAVADVFKQCILQFDKSEFRALSLDTIGV